MVSLPRGLTRVTLAVQAAGRPQRVVLHFIPPGNVDQDDLQHLSELLNRWWFTGSPSDTTDFPNRYVGQDSNAFFHLLESVNPQFPFNVLVHAVRFAIAFGGATTPALPANSTFCLRKISAGPFRRRNGRLFLPALAREFVEASNSNVIATPAVDGILRAYNGLLEGGDPETVVGAGWVPVVWNRSHQVGGPLAMPTTSQIVRFDVTDRSIDSQIRRLPDHRAHNTDHPHPHF